MVPSSFRLVNTEVELDWTRDGCAQLNCASGFRLVSLSSPSSLLLLLSSSFRLVIPPTDWLTEIFISIFISWAPRGIWTTIGPTQMYGDLDGTTTMRWSSWLNNNNESWKERSDSSVRVCVCVRRCCASRWCGEFTIWHLLLYNSHRELWNNGIELFLLRQKTLLC